MCGRYAIECEEENIFLKEIIEDINRRYAGEPLLSRMKTGEIFPTETVPILAAEGGKTIPFLMNWGFPKTGTAPVGVIINARAETALEKNVFRPSLLSRRCVVPSTGFYEWKQPETKKAKDKYLFSLPGSPMLYMAGFYSRFPDGQGGLMPRFVILTTQANEWVSPCHNRMPLILDSGSCREWLHGSSATHLLLRPCEARLKAVLQTL
jgi:putative SOS response-associated peptidase YedK